MSVAAGCRTSARIWSFLLYSKSCHSAVFSRFLFEIRPVLTRGGSGGASLRVVQENACLVSESPMSTVTLQGCEGRRLRTDTQITSAYSSRGLPHPLSFLAGDLSVHTLFSTPSPVDHEVG